MNNYKKTALFALAALLAGCGATNNAQESVTRPGTGTIAKNQSLIYAYPMANQFEVPVSAPVVLRFTSAVTEATISDAIEIRYQAGSGDQTLNYTSTLADNGRGLVLIPSERLAPFTEYTVVMDDLELASGTIANQTISFTTQGTVDSEVAENATFELSRLVPDGTNYEVIEFSSFRLQFSQPLDATTVVYGSSIALRASNNDLVPATLLTDGFYVTVDPNEDLTPGANYTLSISGGLESVYGNSFSAQSYPLTPLSAGSQANLILEVVDSNPSGVGNVFNSVLTGQAVNVVPISSVLLGNNSQTQLGDIGASGEKGRLLANLAAVQDFESRGKPIPVRVTKGSLLQGSEIELLVGGSVPLGFNTGDVNIEIISDAVGYLVPNPYSQVSSAFRQVVLYLDVAVSTSDPRANGAVTQNILHLQMTGTAELDTRLDGLVLNAVSVVELDILGLEKATSVLSFYTASFPNQSTAPLPPVDILAPTLQTWVPGDSNSEIDYKHRPSDPIMVIFDEPIRAAAEIPFTFTSAGSGAVAMSYEFDGAALVIQPTAPLASDEEYTIDIPADAITDVSGNAVAATQLTFTTPLSVAMTAIDENQYAPVVLATYPGFPCTPVDGMYDLANDDVGPCSGGVITASSRVGGRRNEIPIDSGLTGWEIPADDHMPLAVLPSNRSINVAFSRDMDESSLNAQTLVVERVNAAGVVQSTVAGSWRYENRLLKFTPATAWIEGAYYKYTLKSEITGAQCGIDAICDNDGLPLHTQNLAGTVDALIGPTEGGPDLAIFFKGGPATDAVFAALLAMPTADVNGNFKAELNEPVPSDILTNFELDLLDLSSSFANSVKLSRNPEAYTAGFPALATTSASTFSATGTPVSPVLQVVLDVNVGCGFVGPGTGIPPKFPIEDCGDGQYSYTNSTLFSEVQGFLEPGDPALPADVDAPAAIGQNGAVLAYVNPAQILATSSSLEIISSSSLINFESIDTGPLVLRIRYNCLPSESDCGAPDYGRSKGWIYEGDDGEANFWAKLDIYVDAPALDPVAILRLTAEPHVPRITQYVRSIPITVILNGKLSLLPDGRLNAQLQNTNTVEIVADILAEACFTDVDDDPAGSCNIFVGDPLRYFPSIFLKINPGDISMNFISTPIKQ